MGKRKNWCSFSPDILFGYDLSLACELHDFQYNRGGKYNWKEIKKVDQEFLVMLIHISNIPIALTYYAGVRIAARFTQVLSWVGLW